MDDGNKGIKRQTLAQAVTERLRDEILSGQLSPGQRLIVQTLEERWGVSHIPIREALRELEAEALVESRPGQGVVVAGVDLDELHDLYHLRRLLEGDVLRRGFPSYGPERLQHAQQLLDALLEEEPEPGGSAWWAAHRAFHWAFLEPGCTPWSRRLLNLIWQSCERYQRLYTLVFGSVDQANVEHQHILDVAAGGEVDAFVEEWLAHLDLKEQAIVSGYLARHGEDEAVEAGR